MAKMISGIDKIIIGLIIGAWLAVWLIDNTSMVLAIVFGVHYVVLCLLDMDKKDGIVK